MVSGQLRNSMYLTKHVWRQTHSGPTDSLVLFFFFFFIVKKQVFYSQGKIAGRRF